MPTKQDTMFNTFQPINRIDRQTLKENIDMQAASEPWLYEVSPQLLHDVLGFINFLKNKLSTSLTHDDFIQKKIEELCRWYSVASKCVVHPDSFDMELQIAPEPVEILSLIFKGKLIKAVVFGNGKPPGVENFNDDEAKFCDFSTDSNLSTGYVVREVLGQVNTPREKREIFEAMACIFDPRTKQVIRIDEDRYVLKIVGKTRNAEMDMNLKRESRVQSLLSRLNDPHINKLIRLGEDQQSIYTLSEYAGAYDLIKFLQANIDTNEKAFSEAEVKRLFKNVVHSLSTVHNLGIAHRDLSLENFVTGEQLTMEVIDWGHCCKFDVESKLVNYTGFIGKPKYGAPELHPKYREETKEYDPTKADVFSLGVCIYACLNGTLVFEQMDERALRKLGNIGILLENRFNPTTVDLLSNMLKVDPNERMTMQEVRGHAFFN